MAILVHSTVPNRKETLCVLSCHSEQRCNFHPEQCAGPTSCNCSCYANNIACSDCCRQRRTQCTEAGNFAFPSFLIFYHELQCFSQMANLKPAHSNGQPNSTGEDEDNQRKSPHPRIHLLDDIRQQIQCYHFPTEKYIWIGDENQPERKIFLYYTMLQNILQFTLQTEIKIF